MSYNEGKGSEIEAPFNMAIATLRRLDSILLQIRSNEITYPYDSPEKQKAYLSLVKQFYINAVPLFPKNDNDFKEIGDELLNIKIKKSQGIKKGFQTYIYYYDEELNKKLDDFLITIQIKLRKFFMPDKRDIEGLI